MRVSIEFELPEEKEELMRMLQSGELSSALWDYLQDLRNKLKYGVTDDSELDARTLEWARNKLYELLDEHGIDIEN